jgi:glutamate N-acetyltransferase/amino-acid N-acetyltransferase
MTKSPKAAPKAAGNPAEIVGQTLERALDPLRSVWKTAALGRAERQASQFGAAATPSVKAELKASPNAVAWRDIPPIAGVSLAVGRAGLYRRERDDVLVMQFAEGTSCAGVFTRHGVGSAPVDWCRRQLEAGGGQDVRGLVVNAGCANAFTGRPGADAARRVASALAKRLDCRQSQVMMASTGVIGELLPDAKITARLPEIVRALSPGGWEAAARAIMTTDTFPKGAFAEATIDGAPVRIAGVAKGSGMIAPDMATMLAFVATDAAISPGALQALTRLYVHATFNSVTVDGDRSTNDTLLLFATGQAAAPRVSRPGDARLVDFRQKLEGVLMDLAQQLVRDGEGATKFIKVRITGAASAASARKIARTVCESPLVKTAFAGEDANWGRIVMAVGRADEPINRERISVQFGPLFAARDGRVAADYSEAAMSAYMKARELEVSVDVGVGRAEATMWTCDLTHGYIAINGDYRS